MHRKNTQDIRHAKPNQELSLLHSQEFCPELYPEPHPEPNTEFCLDSSQSLALPRAKSRDQARMMFGHLPGVWACPKLNQEFGFEL